MIDLILNNIEGDFNMINTKSAKHYKTNKLSALPPLLLFHSFVIKSGYLCWVWHQALFSNEQVKKISGE
jgi:hypothetical protein